ncbi:hypothetical protein RRSWK_07200 [Rhodopirellula sp. SWK7]|nr:hypothetical protein RRSWK_07200 [Rhodopirellula sp. SWK7]
MQSRRSQGDGHAPHAPALLRESREITAIFGFKSARSSESPASRGDQNTPQRRNVGSVISYCAECEFA